MREVLVSINAFKSRIGLCIFFSISCFVLKSQVKNGGFETWRTVHPAQDSIPNFWFSYELVTVQNQCGQRTALKTSDAFTGNSAIILEPNSFCDVLPGRVYSIEDIPVSGSVRGDYVGDAYATEQLPKEVSFYYKYQPIQLGDSVSAKALVYHYNEEGQSIDTIAYGETYIVTAVDDYSQHKYDLKYVKNPEPGKDIRFFLDFTTSETIGTKFWLDEVEISKTWIGIPLLEEMETVLVIFPNPSQNTFQLHLPEHVVPSAIELFDAVGNLVKEFPIETRQFQVSELKPGSYYLSVSSKKSLYRAKIQKR